MLNIFKRVTQSSDSLAETVFLTALVLSALAFRYGIYMMLPDNFNYIIYWQQLFEGSFRATSLQTPKPLLVLMFGVLWKLTGSPAFLIVLFIGIGMLAVYGSASIVDRICSPWCKWSVLALLLPSTVFLRAVLSGYSELFSAAGTVWLIARHLERDRIRLPDWWTAIGLFALNLLRPENWLLSAGVAITVGVVATVRPSWTCERSNALSEARCLFPITIFPLLAPLTWFGFDNLAFGDALFSFKVTAHYADVTTATNSQVPWHGYIPAVANSIRNQVSLFALACAVIGIAVMYRHRPSLLILLGLPFVTTVISYFVVYITGMALYDRFLFVPVLMILVSSCIGLAWATKWLLRRKIRHARTPRDNSPPAVGKRVLVIVATTLALTIEHRNLPSKISEFDTYARWRISALSAAEAVRRDSDYVPSRLVAVRVEDLALVGWALRTDGRNLIETQIYKSAGARLSSEVLIAYFIINQPHQGKLFSELTSGRVTGFHTNIIFDDSTTVVYKVRRTLVN